MGIAGVAGYVLRKLQFDPSPIVLAMVLGPMMEQALRQGLMMSRGEFGIFLSRPISAVMLAAAALLLLAHLVTLWKHAQARRNGRGAATLPVEPASL